MGQRANGCSVELQEDSKAILKKKKYRCAVNTERLILRSSEEEMSDKRAKTKDKGAGKRIK